MNNTLPNDWRSKLITSDYVGKIEKERILNLALQQARSDAIGEIVTALLAVLPPTTDAVDLTTPNGIARMVQRAMQLRVLDELTQLSQEFKLYDLDRE